MSVSDAQNRLGFTFRNLGSQEIVVERMLAKSTGIGGLEEDAIMKTKDKIYERILDHLIAEGYPTESGPEFKEPNVNDLVLHIIVPIITDFIRMTGHKITERERDPFRGR